MTVHESVKGEIIEKMIATVAKNEKFKSDLCLFQTTEKRRFEWHTFENHSVSGNKNSFSACRNLIYGHNSKTKSTKGVPHLTKEDQQKLTHLTGLNWVLKYNESFCLSKEYGRGLSKYICFHEIY